MAPPILMLRNVHLTFGGTPLLVGADIMVGPRERLCLVGRNGSGKSTLLRIAAGLVAFDAGERFVQPGATVRYLPQEPDLSGFATTLACAEAGLAPGDDPHRPRYLLDQLGLDGTEDPAHLSGGEARRCALARTLAPAPDVLLLDEPTNHLDLPTIEWLERELASMRSAVVLVSHDRRFLETLSRTTLWLNEGRVRRLDRGFAEFESWRDEILEQEETARHKLDRRIAAETEWLHKGVTARRRRNQGRLRALHDLRRQRGEHRVGQDMAIAASEGEASGRLVIEAKRVEKAYDARPVVTDFSLRVLRGDRLGIVGPNGAGKTTLLGLLTGALAPDSGSVRLGANLEMVTLDQQRESLDPEATLAATLTGGGGDTVSVGGRPRHVTSYLKDFLFSPEQARTAVGALSGGERGRLMLARALARPSNLLVLDEPTNDLDLETLDLLQEVLADYGGTVLLVSHDRDFLDRVVTAVVASDGDGRWASYAGGYSDMIAQRGGLDLSASVATARPGSKASESRSDAKPAVPARKPAPTGERATARPGRLSFKDKHALARLPARIDALNAEIAALQARMADPTLYGRDPAGFAAAAARLTEVQGELAAAEDSWLELELKREDVEGP